MDNIYYSLEGAPVKKGLPIELFDFSDSSSLTISSMTPHWQSLYEMIYVLKGKMLFKVDDILIEADEKDALFISPYQTHSAVKSFTKSYRYVCIVFSEKIINPQDDQTICQKYLTPEVDKQVLFPNYFNYQSKSTSDYAAIIKDIAGCLIDKNWGYELKIPMLILELFYKLLTAHEYTLAESWKKDCYTYIQHLLVMINSNYKHDINFSAISAALGISYSYLSREFKKTIGQSPQAYLGNLRLEHARRHLIKDGRRVSIA